MTWNRHRIAATAATRRQPAPLLDLRWRQLGDSWRQRPDLVQFVAGWRHQDPLAPGRRDLEVEVPAVSQPIRPRRGLALQCTAGAGIADGGVRQRHLGQPFVGAGDLPRCRPQRCPDVNGRSRTIPDDPIQSIQVLRSPSGSFPDAFRRPRRLNWCRLSDSNG